MFGLSKYGFKRKTYNDILKELQRASKDKFGEDINLSNKSIYGMFLELIAWALSLVWQLIEKVYLSAYVRYAEGANLDRIAENIGVVRRGKQRSFGVITVYREEDFTGTISIPAGFMAEKEDGTTYRTTSNYTLQANQNNIDLAVISVDHGKETQADVGEVVEIVTPIDGLDKVENKSKIIGGADEETDAELRERYYQSFGISGSGTRASIEAKLRQLEGVTDVKVLENDTEHKIGDLPRQHIHAILLGGGDNEVAYTILSSKSAGIGTWGKEEVEVADESGHNYKVKFDRAEYVDTYYKVDLIVNDKYSDAHEEEIKEMVCNAVDSHKIGENVYTSKLLMCLCDLEGVLSVSIEASLNKESWESTMLEIGDMEAAKCKEVLINVQQVN